MVLQLDICSRLCHHCRRLPDRAHQAGGLPHHHSSHLTLCTSYHGSLDLGTRQLDGACEPVWCLGLRRRQRGAPDRRVAGNGFRAVRMLPAVADKCVTYCLVAGIDCGNPEQFFALAMPTNMLAICYSSLSEGVMVWLAVCYTSQLALQTGTHP